MKKTYVVIFLLLFALTGCSEEKTDILPENESQQEEYMKEEKSEWTSLSEEELAWFNTSFFNSADKEIVNSFLDSVYSDVKDIDLYRLFYDFPLTKREDLTEEELNALAEKGIDIGLDVQKVPTDYMEEVLKTYANVSLEETNRVKLEQFVYLEEFDAYYISRGDTHQTKRIMESGQKKEDGTIRLQYDEYEVTLVSNGNGYYFVSNLQADADLIFE